jgi:hypothetical protein
LFGLDYKSETSKTLKTYVYSHSNTCNIQIKHLKHIFETLETLTYAENIRV